MNYVLMHESKVKSLCFMKQGTLIRIPLNRNQAKVFLSDDSQDIEKLFLTKHCHFRKHCYYSITKSNYVFYLCTKVVDKILSKYNKKDLLGFHVEIQKLSTKNSIEIDIDANDYPFNIKDMHVHTYQFIDNFFPVVDGVVKTVDNYGKYLNKQGDKTVVYTPYYDNCDDSELPYDVTRTKSKEFKFTEYAIPTPNADKKLKYSFNIDGRTILHAHSPFVMGNYALKIAKYYHVPLVSTFHSKYYDDFLMITKSKFIARKLTDRIVDFYNHCDAVWTVNEGTANTLKEYGYKGKILVMPNGTNYPYPENIDEIKKLAIDKYDIKKEERNILFVGHLIWQKNIKLVLDTIAALDNEKEVYHLRLVGTGGSETDIKEYASKIKLKHNKIDFVGSITDSNLLQGMYATHDLFFFPSIYDNAPLVLREAATMKLPALLVEKTNAAENIQDGINGYLGINDVNYMKNKIIDIYKDPSLMKLVGENASKTIPISWEEIVKDVHNAYIDVLKEYREKSLKKANQKDKSKK